MIPCDPIASCHDGHVICAACAFALDKAEYGLLEAVDIARRHGRAVPDHVERELKLAALEGET